MTSESALLECMAQIWSPSGAPLVISADRIVVTLFEVRDLCSRLVRPPGITMHRGLSVFSAEFPMLVPNAPSPSMETFVTLVIPVTLIGSSRRICVRVWSLLAAGRCMLQCPSPPRTLSNVSTPGMHRPALRGNGND